MSIIELLLKEVELEAQTTRKMLSIIPDDKFDWQPHPKSMTVKALANHIAELFGWLTYAVTTDGLDFATNFYRPGENNKTSAILAAFEHSYEDGKAHLAAATDEMLTEPWVLRNGDFVISSRTRYDTVRIAIAQTIHHRAQLGVFLRLMDVAIPGSYGPSKDDLLAQAQ